MTSPGQHVSITSLRWTTPPDYDYIDLTRRRFFRQCNHDLLFRRTRLTLSFIGTAVLLAIITFTSFFLESLNGLAHITSGALSALATVASILSMAFYFFPLKRDT